MLLKGLAVFIIATGLAGVALLLSGLLSPGRTTRAEVGARNEWMAWGVPILVKLLVTAAIFPTWNAVFDPFFGDRSILNVIGSALLLSLVVVAPIVFSLVSRHLSRDPWIPPFACLLGSILDTVMVVVYTGWLAGAYPDGEISPGYGMVLMLWIAVESAHFAFSALTMAAVSLGRWAKARRQSRS